MDVRLPWLVLLICGLMLCFLLLAFTPEPMRSQDALPGSMTNSHNATTIVPMGLVERTGDQSVILHWDAMADADLAGYHVYRAASTVGPFAQRSADLLHANHFVDFDVENNQTYHYQVRAFNTARGVSRSSEIIRATPVVLNDDAFLNLVQHTAFDYFWYEANPQNGLIKDRSIADSPCNIATVGFGLSALTVGIDRGWISREAGRERVRAALTFLHQSPQGPEPDATGYKGFYYRFLDMQTGRRVWDSELSTVDTALLLAGVLHVQQYFDQDDASEAEIRRLADALYRRVDWKWMQVRAEKISHGWRPETGFLPYDWDGYSEAMILYLLALGSPTSPVSHTAWTAWTSTYTWQTHYDHAFVVFPPLFGHQYSHVWIDFRGMQDAYMRRKGIDYFENSRRATLANWAYTQANPHGWSSYSTDKVWGLTSSDAPTGYRAHGAPPAYNDDGTLSPTAPGGSFAFTPHESLTALRHMYDTYRPQLWGPYGFKDAFNPTQNWFATDYLGIDQGPIVLMIENYRSGRIWKRSMQSAAIQHGLREAGFMPTEDTEKPQKVAETLPKASQYN
jgi:hypothetical protein